MRISNRSMFVVIMCCTRELLLGTPGIREYIIVLYFGGCKVRELMALTQTLDSEFSGLRPRSRGGSVGEAGDGRTKERSPYSCKECSRQKGGLSCWAAAGLCRPLRTRVQRLPLIRPANMRYLMDTCGPLFLLQAQIL